MVTETYLVSYKEPPSRAPRGRSNSQIKNQVEQTGVPQSILENYINRMTFGDIVAMLDRIPKTDPIYNEICVSMATLHKCATQHFINLMYVPK